MLHTGDVVADTLDILVMALDHVIIKGDLLLEASDHVDHVSLGWASRRGMLMLRRTH